MTYLYLKAFHVIAVIAWMAGLFYLPRLYVYHADAKPGSELSETFKVMERRLLKAITTPAMLASWALGLILAFGFGSIDWATDIWFHVKLLLVIALTVFHMALARWRKEFEADKNERPALFYRIANEVPTLLLIGIVILVIVRPF
jgi:putative membrane protein